MLADRVRISAGKSRELIDRTTPTVVVDQPYSIEGNGGRKLVRLDNGWLVAGAHYNSTIVAFVSEDSGKTWIMANGIGGTTNNNFSLVNIGNKVGILFQNATSMYFRTYDPISNTNSSAIPIDNQTTLGKCSLTTNKQGTELHACWASKNATYPNSFNIRYCKGIINGDGSVTWGSVEQVTPLTSIGDNNESPIIIMVEEEPMIIFVNRMGNLYRLISYKKVELSWTSSVSTIYRINSYPQSSPSACVDKDGAIHVAWTGVIEGNVNSRILYSKSLDGGVSWSKPVDIVPGNVSTVWKNPSISVNVKNEIFVNFANNANQSWLRMTFDGQKWNDVVDSPVMSSHFHPSLLIDNNLDFDIPLTIFMTGNYAPIKNSVVFMGRWYE